MNSSVASAVGIDIGGTRVKSVIVDDQGKMLEEDERDSIEGAAAFVSLVESILADLGASEQLPVGISCPGLAQRDHRAIACTSRSVSRSTQVCSSSRRCSRIAVTAPHTTPITVGPATVRTPIRYVSSTAASVVWPGS